MRLFPPNMITNSHSDFSLFCVASPFVFFDSLVCDSMWLQTRLNFCTIVTACILFLGNFTSTTIQQHVKFLHILTILNGDKNKYILYKLVHPYKTFLVPSESNRNCQWLVLFQIIFNIINCKIVYCLLYIQYDLICL